MTFVTILSVMFRLSAIVMFVWQLPDILAAYQIDGHVASKNLFGLAALVVVFLVGRSMKTHIEQIRAEEADLAKMRYHFEAFNRTKST